MRLVTIRTHTYPPQTVRKIGEEYEAKEQDAQVLIAAGLVRFSNASSTYETKENRASPLAKDDPVKTKKQYKRRDMNPQ